jgi:diguanylate cyclase (GGDEF)-like protein
MKVCMTTRFRRQSLRLSFAMRLIVAMVTTFAFVGAVSYALTSRLIERRIMASHVAEQRADASSIAAINRRFTDRKTILAEVDEVLDVVDRRPGTLETLLIDSGGVVRAAGGEGRIGTTDRDPRIDAALRDGLAYAGREGDTSRDTGDLEFVIPVEIAGQRYAYEMTLDHKRLDAELRDTHNGLLVVGLLTLLLGGMAFYLIGGRALLRSHRLALHGARRDGLTDLPNLRAFQEDLPAAVGSAARHDDALVLMLLDADDFKFLNDRHGHPHGDAVLRRIAAVLRDGRAGDAAYRLGGDEFAVILPRTDEEGARTRTLRLISALGAANVTMSIGAAALSPGQGPELLRREADAALYEAKRCGGNRVVHFEDVRADVVITTSDKLNAIHQLLEGKRLEVAYQPIWNLQSGDLLGVEALARPHADYGFAGPAEAFDLAEQVGRVPQLDMICVASALATAPALPPGALLFLNLSPQTLDVNGDDWILRAVTESGLAPADVVIEVTERFSGRTTAVAKGLQRLRGQGFKLALDDVGTGNSGLEMLRLVDADFVKIDRSIVCGATEDPNARAVLMAMATYASHTGAFVIAEGIEDLDMLDFLRHIDDDELRVKATIQGGQGYGLGRPAAEPSLTDSPLSAAK